MEDRADFRPTKCILCGEKIHVPNDGSAEVWICGPCMNDYEQAKKGNEEEDREWHE